MVPEDRGLGLFFLSQVVFFWKPISASSTAGSSLLLHIWLTLVLAHVLFRLTCHPSDRRLRADFPRKFFHVYTGIVKIRQLIVR